MQIGNVPGMAWAATLCFALLWGVGASAGESASPTEPVADVFSQGDATYPNIRIPAVVVTGNGVVLAFAEGRQGGDHSENDIIVRRSTDGGRTWGPVQVIAAMGGDSLNDPCAVALDNGRVLLLYQRYPQGFHTRKMSHTKRADLGYDGPRNTQTFLTYSDDDGKTWAEPEDVTRTFRREDAISVGSPGIGIQLKSEKYKGRIVFPLYEVMPEEGGDRYWNNCAAYSDDGGKSWTLGQRVDQNAVEGTANEAQIVELADGRILMNARNTVDKPCRKVAVSKDGGETWSPMREDCGLVAPRCMGSIIACPDPAGDGQLVLVSLPNTTDSRSNGTIFISRDGGETWPQKRVIYPEYFGYSCLTVLPDGRIGCLFERADTAITSFGAYDIEWLLSAG
jgi:sialidase-1